MASQNTITTNDTTRTISVSIGASNYLNFAHRTGDTNVTQVYCGNNPNRLTVAMDITDATTRILQKEKPLVISILEKQRTFLYIQVRNKI